MSLEIVTDIDRQIEELKTEVLECRKCGLCETRSNVVYGEGNPNTPMVLVGEGPGANEDATGRPFVGRAGQLLDECLLVNGITRKHIYICNVIKCRAGLIEGKSIKNRPPKPEEITCCLPWLEKQLEIIKPTVVLSLGSPSANAIIHKDFRIMKERGTWFTSPYAKYVMAALHPAYILRQGGEALEGARSSLVADIAAARAKVIEAKKEAKAENG